MNITKIFGIIALIFFTALCGALFFIFTHKWVDFSALEQYNPGKPSIVLDDEDKEWARFELDRRAPIALKELPEHLIQAFLAAEDRQFFTHSGISVKGSIRSAFVNIINGRIVQGASTITQQLVKLLFFNSRRTFKRKIKEQFFSLLIEQQFSKEQILETYLNHIYLGNGIYGVEAAAQRFWGKSARDITIDEAAVLAGIVRSPENYCPLNNPRATYKMRNIVLNALAHLNFISAQELSVLKNKPLTPLKPRTLCIAPHAREMVRQWLEERYGKEMVYTGGLVIKTTINQAMQVQAHTAYQRHLKRIRAQKAPHADSGMVTIQVKTGEIKVLIGGFDFSASQFNRALQARRQIGSTFKPLVYGVALMKGAHFSDTEIDEPITIVYDNQPWEPNNVNKKFNGTMTLAGALARSNNIIAVKTLLRAGIADVIEYAYKAHLPGPIPPYPSIALGCLDASVVEVCGYFNLFANNGTCIEPYFIEWVKDQWSKKIWRYTAKKTPVLPWKISSQVAQVLSRPLLPCDMIGKTGTTNDARSCWFVGSTPAYTTAIYIGNDDNTPMPQIYSAYTAVPLWVDFNKAITQPISHFSYEPSLSSRVIDRMTGKETSTDNPQAIKILE